MRVYEGLMHIDHLSREIQLRIAFCGAPHPGLVGALDHIRGQVEASEARAFERGVEFDFVPKSLRDVNGFAVRLRLYAFDVVSREACRTLLDEDMDGVVFVIGDDGRRIDEHGVAFGAIAAFVERRLLDGVVVPLVLQRPGGTEMDELQAALSRIDPAFGSRTLVDADGTSGAGVFDVLKAITKETLAAVRDRLP